MKPSGIVLILVGAWVLCQILGGNALGRLGVAGAAPVAGTNKLQGE